MPPAAELRRDAPITRARMLAARHPAAAEPLTFYASLCAFQQTLVPAAASASTLDRDAVVAAIPGLLRWLQTSAPAPLAGAAARLAGVAPEEWQRRLHEHLDADGGETSADDPFETFVLEAVSQPFAAAAARATAAPPAGDKVCPTCRIPPLASLLREEGQGARRSLICGRCATEWPAMRLGCQACGEQQFEKLPVFTAEQFPHVRIDACDSCRTYLKTLDLTKDGLAIAAVDDIASLSMDLWAREQGYRRLQASLLAL